MEKTVAEWLRQADYDMKTADAMFNSKRYFYAVFMCHLSLEKALKALYPGTLKALPPKTHNLIYLTEKISLELPTELNEFLQRLNLESVATRYPDDLQKSIKEYSRKRTAEILKKSKQVLKWLKAR
jgi:HEPN domain-containing protein